MQRWTEYAVRDASDGEIEGGPFESRRNAQAWIDRAPDYMTGPFEIVEREMTAGDFTPSLLPVD